MSTPYSDTWYCRALFWLSWLFLMLWAAADVTVWQWGFGLTFAAIFAGWLYTNNGYSGWVK